MGMADYNDPDVVSVVLELEREESRGLEEMFVVRIRLPIVRGDHVPDVPPHSRVRRSVRQLGLWSAYGLIARGEEAVDGGHAVRIALIKVVATGAHPGRQPDHEGFHILTDGPLDPFERVAVHEQHVAAGAVRAFHNAEPSRIPLVEV